MNPLSWILFFLAQYLLVSVRQRSLSYAIPYQRFQCFTIIVHLRSIWVTEASELEAISEALKTFMGQGRDLHNLSRLRKFNRRASRVGMEAVTPLEGKRKLYYYWSKCAWESSQSLCPAGTGKYTDMLVSYEVSKRGCIQTAYWEWSL